MTHYSKLKNKFRINSFLLTVVLSVIGVTAQAQSLSPMGDKDLPLNPSYQAYQTQQAAIQALNDTGKYPVASYAMAKAQCWLDVSFHEFTRNDRSKFVPQALAESVKLTQTMKFAPDALGPVAAQTTLVNGTKKVREDLWSRAEKIKSSIDFGGSNNCAERLVACAEVELVHASNELNQQGWRHSRPYIQIAEDSINQAATALEQCAPSAVVREIVYVQAPAVAPAPVVVAPVPVVISPQARAVPAPFMQSATVLFNYNKNDINNVRDASKSELDAFIAGVKSAIAKGMKIQSIEVTGHADRANGTGIANYNDTLSKSRAETIKQYLFSNGIFTDVTTVAAKGDSQQVQTCNNKFKSKAELQECLLPNRRVVLLVKGLN